VTRFRILKTTDPFPYKSELERLWRENLPGTAPGRLKWMTEGNPAGPATWFLAFDKARDALAGTISVMPKTLLVDGRPVLSGIIGDLMVDRRYRVFGPAVLLPKAVMNDASALGMTYLYTMPNRASVKILERCSFEPVVSYESLVRPIDLTGYLGKYLGLPSGLARVLAVVERSVEAFLNRVLGGVGGFFSESDLIDESFGPLCEEFARRNPEMLMGERRVEYLRWRYMENPQYDFKVLALRPGPGEPVSGYIIYSSSGDMMEIFDLISLEDGTTKKLIRKLIRIARERGCRAVYATMNPRMRLAGLLRRHLFFRNRDRFGLYSPAGMAFQAENWYSLAGDRNL